MLMSIPELKFIVPDETIFDTNWTNNEKSNLIWPECLSNNLSLYCLFFLTFFF